MAAFTVRQVANGALRSAGWVIAAIYLTGCGGSTTATTDSIATFNPPEPEVKNGVFKDANVRGLTVTAGATSSVTDARGRFTCKTGERLTFSVGAAKLGETECTTLVHPAMLVGSGAFHDPAALDMARFLMLLDQDADAANGIFISDALRNIAASWAPLPFGTPDFEARLPAILSDIYSVENRIVTAAPTPSAAFAHMAPTLACAYSGAFHSELIHNGRDVGAVTLIVMRDPSTNVDMFELERFLAPLEGPATTLSATGEVQPLSYAREVSYSTWQTNPIFFHYVSSDRVLGHWTDQLSTSFASSATDFIGLRIGSDTMDYRFAGRYSAAESRGVVVLGLNGDRLVGEAVEFATGHRAGLSGTIAGDRVELSLGAGSATAAATVERDGQRSPIRISGAWPGASGTFSAVGCRLN
jgi:hypothetical protein